MAGAIDENGAVIVNYNNQSTKIDKNGYKAYVDANGNTQSGTYTVDGGETHNYVILAGPDNKKYICDYHGDIHEVTSIDANGVITAGNAVTNAPVTKIVGGTNGFNVDGHQNATAFGNATRATAAESTAWGQGSIASGEASTAFGIKSKAEGKNSLAGLGGQAVNENSIALGKDTKANNAQQAVSMAIGENAEASGARSLAIGFGVKGKVTEGGVEKDDTTLTQTTASGESAVSIGTDTQAAGQHSIAFGSHTEATKDSSLAIGYDTHATEASAVAIGSGTKVNRGFGVAVGLSALAGIDESDPSSSDAKALDGSQTVAFGYYARATATNAAALGAATSANVNGGVALGYGSATTRAAGNKVNGVEQKAYLKPASVDSTNNSTWTSTAGAVSVGNVGAKQSITRQITDVAAGSKDTDAVNVAQLKQAGFTVTANTDATAGSSIKTGETLDFKAADNAIVSTTKDSKTITVKVSKTPTFDSVTTGDTVINNAGLTVGGKTYVSNAGLNANKQVITNVANGKADNDAVNVSQLKNSRTVVTSSDKSIQVADTANGNPNHAYDIKVNYGEVANNTSISYKANGGTAQSVTLKNGLNFTNGANTTAEVGADGVVKVNATNMRVQSGKATYSDDGNGSISMTHHDGTTATISGLKDTYTRSASYDAANKKATFTRNDNTTYDLDLSAIANEAGNGKLNFKGDDETVISKKLNDTLTIKGGQTDASKLSDGKNVGVINEKGALRIELAKKIDLGEDGSVKMGDTTINNNGLTIKKGPTITNKNVSMNNQQIHNVAAGKKGTDAVNVDQLKKVQTLASKHTKVTVEGSTAPKGQTYVGKNLKINVTNSNGQETYDLKLADNLNIGEKGADGKDGKIGVNGKNGSSVVINGKDGTIGLNGKNGTNGLTIRGAAGKDGITRIVYKDAAGKDHPVATLDDGLKFKGDTGDVISKKLNDTLTIKGGQTDASKLSDGKNVGVINEKGALRIELAKKIDLGEDGSVKMGDTTINNNGLTIKKGPTITNKNVSMNNQQIHNVAAGKKGTDAVNVDQLKKVQTLASKHTKVTVEGSTAPKGQTYVGKNLKINVTNSNGQETYDLKLADNLNIGEKGADGKDGKIGVNGKNGSSVVINGKDGTIGLNGKDGTNGLTIRGAAGKPGVDGKDGITRIVYKDAAGKDHPVATLDDGLKFKGDTGDVISKKLNDTLTIKGGQTDPSKLSTGKNVGVVNEKGALRIELAKKIDLGEEGSVKTGDTIINNNGLTIKNGPTITKTNVSMNNQQIHNVAAGKKGTDAVNVDQLNEVQTLASQHTKVTVEGGTAPKDTTYVGKNLKINVTDNKGQKTYDLKLADNLSIGEKGADGKDGKIGVNGKDGSSVVINGKDGTIGLNGKDGTNGLTIRGAAGKPGVDGKDGITRIVYKDAAGKDHPVATLDDGLNFKGDDGTVISKKLNQRMDIVGGANKNNLSENNIGVISDNGKLHVKLAKDLKGLTSVTTTDGKGNTTVQNGKGVTVKDGQNNTATFTAKDITFTNRDKSHKTKLDEDGLTIFTKGASGQANQTIKITNTYISMGGQQIHNVLAGKADTDAVNVSQLKAVQSVAEAHSTVSVGGKKAGKDSVDVKGGNLVLKRTENKNGSKNYDVKLADDISIKSVTTTDDKGNKTVQKGSGITTIDKDGNKTSVTGKGVTTVDKDGNKTSLTGKGMTTVDKDGNKTSITGKGVSISGKDGNKTTITEKGLTIKDGPVVTKDKFSAGGQQIHEVKAGTALTDAVNVSQLKDEIGKVEQHHTEVTVNDGTEAQEGTYNTSGNLQIKKTTDKDGKKTYDLKLADNLTFGAQDGADGKDGVDGSIGVKGKNGSAVVINGKDGSIGLNGVDGKNGLTIKGADGTVGVDRKAGTTRLIYETKDGEKTVKHEVATMDDGMKYSGDSGNAAVKLNKNVQIYGGATKYADGNNIGVVASQDGDNAKLQVKLAKDLKGLDSVTTGNTTINNGGLTIKTSDDSRTIIVQDGNVNMGGNKIEGVADGKVSKDSTDAVNGSQLWQRDQAINGLSGSVNKLGNRINRVGAGAAALAALHPLDFDPDDKWDFAAGYGNYRGANAAAIGAYYRPNEDTMFSVGGSFGGGENMVNAGVSIKLGQGNHVSTSRVAMAKEMKAMRQHMAEQDALIAKLQSMHGMAVDPAKSVLFPDVAENHWAYQYVTTLAKKGILEGYPDGEFKGDRMMTRYEFAAIVYRIVESGVGSTDPELSKLVKEFSPELQYIRIDTIQKDRNGKPTIERVRVISDAK